MEGIPHLHSREFFSWPRLRSRKITSGLSAACAGYFQASSEFIKRDMLAHFPDISPEQITVIPEGVNLNEFSAPAEASALRQYELAQRFLFLPAHLWPHKNHLTLLRPLLRLQLR